MTIKEANEAARQLLPVIFNEMEFERITQVGISYNDKGEPHYFLQILGKNHGSVVYVDPNRCTVKPAD